MQALYFIPGAGTIWITVRNAEIPLTCTLPGDLNYQCANPLSEPWAQIGSGPSSLSPERLSLMLGRHSLSSTARDAVSRTASRPQYIKGMVVTGVGSKHDG